MMDAPGPVDQLQLDELGLQLRHLSPASGEGSGERSMRVGPASPTSGTI